jgi:hypothetical protein
LAKAKVTNANYNEVIRFGTSGTYTELTPEANIQLTQDNDVKVQVIKLTHELTNRSKTKATLKMLDDVKKGIITPEQYAKAIAQSEVAGEINQVKVAADIGYRYKGREFEGLNKLIDAYKKDKTIDLTKRVIAATEHLAEYEREGREARADYLTKHPPIKKH